MYLRPTPELILHNDRGNVDVTAIINAFENTTDYAKLMLSAQDFCLCGGDSKYSWIYAKEAVEDWHFAGGMYRQLREYYIDRGMPEHIMWKTAHLELRAMFLQDLAIVFNEYEKQDHLDNSNRCSPFREWQEAKQQQEPCQLSCQVDGFGNGAYFFSIDC